MTPVRKVCPSLPSLAHSGLSVGSNTLRTGTSKASGSRFKSRHPVSSLLFILGLCRFRGRIGPFPRADLGDGGPPCHSTPRQPEFFIARPNTYSVWRRTLRLSLIALRGSAVHLNLNMRPSEPESSQLCRGRFRGELVLLGFAPDSREHLSQLPEKVLVEEHVPPSRPASSELALGSGCWFNLYLTM